VSLYPLPRNVPLSAALYPLSLSRVETFTDNAPPSDDRTLIAIRVA
jgi:hypothetical protein